MPPRAGSALGGTPARPCLLFEVSFKRFSAKKAFSSRANPHNLQDSRWLVHRESFIGQIPKWPTGEDCKSSGFAFTGSNPVLPTPLIIKELWFRMASA